MLELVKSQFASYLAEYPAEDLSVLAKQLEAGDDVLSRSNMRGHVTTSAFILNQTMDQALLIDHKFLQMWLQPGGHYEGDGSLLNSALREVLEETGVTARLVGSETPLDIDTHIIPANPKKGEDEHYHHDFVYLTQASTDDVLTAQVEEINGLQWINLESLAQGEDRTSRLAKKTIAWLANGNLPVAS